MSDYARLVQALERERALSKRLANRTAEVVAVQAELVALIAAAEEVDNLDVYADGYSAARDGLSAAIKRAKEGK